MENEATLDAMYEQIPRIEAERSMRAATAALYPHLTKRGAQDLWRAWAGQARRTAGAAAAFTWNGVQMGARQIKAKLAETLGGGFSQ